MSDSCLISCNQNLVPPSLPSININQRLPHNIPTLYDVSRRTREPDWVHLLDLETLLKDNRFHKIAVLQGSGGEEVTRSMDHNLQSGIFYVKTLHGAISDVLQQKYY
jgi:hypothetical protein